MLFSGAVVGECGLWLIRETQEQIKNFLDISIFAELLFKLIKHSEACLIHYYHFLSGTILKHKL